MKKRVLFKRCNTCHTVKSVTEFYRTQREYLAERRSRCITCCKRRQREKRRKR